MFDIIEYVSKQEKYKKVIDKLTSPVDKSIYIGNAASNLDKVLATITFLSKKQNVIYVCENIYESSKAYETFCDLLSPEQVSFFPVEEFISSELVASSQTFRLARMLTLYNITEGNPRLIVTSTEGITRQMMSKKRIEESTLKLCKNQIIEMKDLVLNLIMRGYKKVSITENSGTFSIRGSIIDIFPINEENLYRINFFDNEIDSIKKVNIETQMSIEQVDSIYIFPLYDLYYSESEIEEIEKRILKKHKRNEKLDKDLEKIKNYDSLDQLNIYLPYIDPLYTPFLSLFDNPICFYEDLNKIFDHEEASIIEIREYLSAVCYNGEDNFFLSVKDALALSKQNIYFSSNISSLNDIKLTDLIDLKTLNNFDYNNNMKSVIEDLKTNVDRTYIITHFDEKNLTFLKETFASSNLTYNEGKIKKGCINLEISPSAHGFIDLDTNTEILTPFEFSSNKINKQSKYQKYYKNTTKIYNREDILPGDYVVHQDYGIGMYVGIDTREIRGKKCDYLKIVYADEGKLLVPIENIYLLEKYNSSKDTTPKLNRIDGKEWKKKKAKVKEKVMDVARRLIKVQAERETKQGYIYKPDTVDQMHFEEDFPFTETIDQEKAIKEVKQDMEGKKPLDRLICGDVGFGKTEVAMRAAFKAVENGKQVAYLAPTTVLTRQHFYSFKSRFSKYGVRVELLNRFVPLKKQKEVLEGLKKGYVDIIIGTHRILSNDIVFKDLGLLIIDEEQRFGVLHKERIKEMKSNVDVLTLTATPIPRTLQMSLSGLRDLSLIETPPVNRLPVQTYVLETNDSVIREAINRELGRGGQVFYLLNRIEELDKIISKVHRLVPIAKVGVIHGRMDKDEIEDQLVSFLDQKYNVLVCTTIIETGIDIPNANTLIIEKADYLGLSQLYQIRGRVGRSDRIAYAYLMYDKQKILNDIAVKRLNAIKEFTSLGSGYRIAMRDLAIRGAGDILGDEQSGFIDAIGMDLYMQLLQQAINEIKGVKEEDKDNKHYNIAVDRHVDTSYVSDDDIRIEIHKQICKIKSRDQINKLIDEYTDRYGKLSPNILLYMEEKYLEYLLKVKGIENIKEKDDEVILNFDVDVTKLIDYQSLREAAKKYAPKFIFSLEHNTIYIKIELKDYSSSYIYTLTRFLENVSIKS